MVRTLVVTVTILGQTKSEQGKQDCVIHYEESIKLYNQIDDKPAAAISAFNLGHAYKDIPAIRDLEKAGQWYARSLELRDERDRLGRGKCANQLGAVAFEQFKEARAAQKPNEELLEHINTALRHYHTALEMIPADAVDDLAVTHGMLGTVYGEAGHLDAALKHYNQSIHYQESQGNFHNAAAMRFNLALNLRSAGRIPDALDYARAALRNFEMYGDRAADMIERTKELIQQLEGLNQDGQDG